MVLVASCGADASSNRVGAAVPSPLFGSVEELVLGDLPDGWVRCGGGPSTLPGATDRWWSQTFGPDSGADCRPSVTVTQIPATSGFDVPFGAEDTKLAGNADAARWTDDDSGAVGIFTWTFDQNLVVVACCGTDAAEHVDTFADAALVATRQHPPAHCSGASSDLAQESLIENLTSKQMRVLDADGCPLRSDLAVASTTSADHHGWPGVTTLVVGTPIGTSTRDTPSRTYRRDPAGATSGGIPNPHLDLDAVLSPGAAATGYTHLGRAIWIDESDDSLVYVIDDDTVEAWPRDDRDLACA
jgi:hypothetical protein